MDQIVDHTESDMERVNKSTTPPGCVWYEAIMPPIHRQTATAPTRSKVLVLIRSQAIGLFTDAYTVG